MNSNQAASLAAGTTVLERYRIERLIGRGGMGEVYLAQHTLLGMPVAVKILSGELGQQPMSRFEREAQLMAQVRHPNVVSILDVGFVRLGGQKVPCMILEFVDGEPLNDRLSEKALLWRDAVPLFKGLLHGLSAIHRLGIWHRDLKPMNVLIAKGPPEQTKIIDFGIAKPLNSDAQLTATGMMIGTPAYMSPEQATGGTVDQRSDLYSAGLLLYEMLSGKLALVDEWNRPDLAARFAGPPPPPTAPEGQQPIPAWLQSLCLQLLGPTPHSRLPSADYVLERLEATAHDELISPEPFKTPMDKGSGMTPFTPPPADGATVVLQEADDPLAPADDASSPQNYVVGARIPPSRLARQEERQWLGSLVGSDGRGFSLGSQAWFALIAPVGEAAEAINRIESGIRQRYGSSCRVLTKASEGPLQLTTAMLSGSRPLPDLLRHMVAELSSN